MRHVNESWGRPAFRKLKRTSRQTVVRLSRSLPTLTTITSSEKGSAIGWFQGWWGQGVEFSIFGISSLDCSMQRFNGVPASQPSTLLRKVRDNKLWIDPSLKGPSSIYACGDGGNSRPYFFPSSITRGMSCCCSGLSAPISSKNPSKPDGVMMHMRRPGVWPR